MARGGGTGWCAVRCASLARRAPPPLFHFFVALTHTHTHKPTQMHPTQAIDDDSNQTGQMLAGLLGWPQAAFASKLEFVPGGKTVKVLREVDGGLQNIEVTLPCVVTADLRLNEPRYATLPNIMKAKKKAIEAVGVDKTGVDVAPRLTVVSMGEPGVRKGGKKVGSMDELMTELKSKGLVA